MSEEVLKKALIEGTLPNALLFSGGSVQTKKAALWLASELLRVKRVESHPDFHTIAPEGKSGLHSIESIRSAIDISHSASFSAPAKAFLIEAAEKMQPAAANALLKTLEEPVQGSYWILLSERAQKMLPTILSRLSKFSFLEEDLEPKAIEFQEAKTLLLSLVDTKSSYLKLHQTFERIEELMEEKDPAPLFTFLAGAFRDLERNNRAPRWEEAFEEARAGFERNIKLTTCLEFFFLSIF